MDIRIKPVGYSQRNVYPTCAFCGNDKQYIHVTGASWEEHNDTCPMSDMDNYMLFVLEYKALECDNCGTQFVTEIDLEHRNIKCECA
jgi:hypothetical protein